jgi:hypothetical protein
MSMNPYRETATPVARVDTELAAAARSGRLRAHLIRAAPAAACAAALGIIGLACAAFAAMPELEACPSVTAEQAGEDHVTAIEGNRFSTRERRLARRVSIWILGPPGITVEEGPRGPLIERALASDYPVRRLCYLAGTLSGGVLTVRFTAAASGKLMDIKDAGSTVENEVVQCMVRWLSRARLVPTAGAPVRAAYSVRLLPSGSTQFDDVLYAQLGLAF